MTIKDKPSFEFDDPQFMADFAFLTDLSSPLASIKLKLQQRERLIYVLFSHVKAFQAKFKLFELQLGNEDVSHFPVMAHVNCTVRTKFCKAHF